LVEGQPIASIECPSCGSQFGLATAETATFAGVARGRSIGHFDLLEPIEGEAAKVTMSLEAMTGTMLESNGTVRLLDNAEWRARLAKLSTDRASTNLPPNGDERNAEVGRSRQVTPS